MGKIYIISTVEQFPIIDGDRAPWRSLKIAKMLDEKSEKVHLITSSYNHYTKTFRNKNYVKEFSKSTNIDATLMPSIKYRENVGIPRILNYILQTIFLILFFAYKKRKDDKVIITVPAIEHLVILFLFRFKRTVIDYRDLWPDIFLDVQFSPLKGKFRDLLVLVYSKILKIAINRCNLFVTITDGFKDYLSKRYDSLSDSKCIVLGQIKPINLNFKFKNTDESNQVRLVYAGLLSKRTNSVSILRSILNRYEDQIIELSACGHGDAIEDCIKLSKENSKFKFYGSLPQEKLLELYAQSDYGIVAYPNSRDFSISFPNKVWEYLSYGLPFIHTGLDSIRVNQSFKEVGCLCLGEPIIGVKKQIKLNAIDLANRECLKNMRALSEIADKVIG